MMTSFQVK